MASGLDAFPASYSCFLWIPKVTGGIFETLFFGRLGPVYMVVCCSAGGWFGRFHGQWFGRFRFLWIPKVTGGIFETFCFPVVLALCIWWFAVAQAAGLDAFVASGLDAFFASYNCFLWIPKVTGSILCWH